MFYKETVFIFFKTNYTTTIISFLLLLLHLPASSQTDKQNQVENQYEFNKIVGKKTALELDLNNTYTSGENENNPFYKSSQIAGQIWLHYYASPKWKISGAMGYIYNKNVPELNKTRSPEIRFTAQGIYYFIKDKSYVLTNRFRIEDRMIQDADSNLSVVYRFREMIKLVHPFTKIKFGKGSLYGIASEEICLQTNSQITGNNTFERNRLTLGAGYSFSNTFQFELTYVNEYLPRNPNDKMYNIVGVKLIFNDFISILRKENGSIPTY